MSFEESEISVGPFGSQNGGEHFDHGVYSTVRQFVIHHYATEGLFNIQFEYDNNGLSFWSNQLGRTISIDAALEMLCKAQVKKKLGGVEPGPEIQEIMAPGMRKRDKVKLEYPDEFLTSVHGFYTKKLVGPSYITSLTFTSNKKEYGPFGSTRDEDKTKAFSIQVSAGSKIVGFHGRSSKYLGLCALGAYLMPLDQQTRNYHQSKALTFYPSKTLLPPGHRSQNKPSGDDNPNKHLSYAYFALSNIRVSKNKGDHNGSFSVGNIYKYKNYYIEKQVSSNTPGK